jgi:8-oxo-dGTP diphosphatase
LTLASPLQVVAGVIRNSKGEVLINQRSAPVQFAGQWEFPGGKIESGETRLEALVRELREELAIDMLTSSPLISLTHDYPHATVQLNVRDVTAYGGTVVGAEGQAVRWVSPDDLPQVNFMQANKPIVNAVRLPSVYLNARYHPREANLILSRLEHLLEEGRLMVELDGCSTHSNMMRDFSGKVIELCRAHGSLAIANADPDWALDLGFDGVQLEAEKIRALDTRPVPCEYWLGVTCRNREDLDLAQRRNADFVLMDVPMRKSIGQNLQDIDQCLPDSFCESARIPVYIPGEMSRSGISCAREFGAQGVKPRNAVLWQ